MARGSSNRGFTGKVGAPISPGPAGRHHPGKAQVATTFSKNGALVTGDFLGEAKKGDLAVDTNGPDLFQCTNAGTAAWEKVGLQT